MTLSKSLQIYRFNIFYGASVYRAPRKIFLFDQFFKPKCGFRVVLVVIVQRSSRAMVPFNQLSAMRHPFFALIGTSPQRTESAFRA